MKLNKLLLLSIVCITSTALYSQKQNVLHDTIETRIKNVENSLSPLVQQQGEVLWNLEAQMLKYKVSGLSLAVINDYKIEWAKGYGITNQTEKSLVSKQTVFQAASISKFVNAVALMKLKELEDINLNADINELMTSWKFPYDQKISTQSITLRQLLSHTAGISTHGFGGYKNQKKLPSIIETLEGRNEANSDKVKPLFPPNKKFKYSGGGTTISQLILTDNSNTSYENFIENRIFKPLGITHSFYSIEFEKYPKDIAFAHLSNGRTLKNKYHIYPESAAAGLWTNASDLSKLIIDLQKSLTNQNGLILTNKSSEELIAPTLQNEISALGLFVENQNGTTYLQHSGSNKGFRAKVYFGAKNGKGVVVMVNGPNTKIIEEIIRSVASVYKWPGFKNLKAETSTNLTKSNLQKYVGTYVVDDRAVHVSLKKGTLIVTEKGKWKSRLTPLDKSTFVANDIKPQATMQFSTNENGVVNKLIVQQDITLEWIKTE